MGVFWHMCTLVQVSIFFRYITGSEAWWLRSIVVSMLSGTHKMPSRVDRPHRHLVGYRTPPRDRDMDTFRHWVADLIQLRLDPRGDTELEAALERMRAIYREFLRYRREDRDFRHAPRRYRDVMTSFYLNVLFPAVLPRPSVRNGRRTT